MKKFFALFCLCLALLGSFSITERAMAQGRDVHCLVLSNTGHFESISPQPLRAVMEKFGGVNYTFMSNLETLSVDIMNKYDVVWVYNFAEWGMTSEGKYGNISAKNFSDILGEYVEKGGSLVECMYLSFNASRNTMGLGSGKYIDGKYSPFEQTDGTITERINMGEISEINHPIMKNVKAVSTEVPVLLTKISEGATLLAKWYEVDRPLAAVKNNVVGINFAPIHLNSFEAQLGPGAYVYGDGFRLLDNSIKWLFSKKFSLTAPDTVSSLLAVPTAVGSAYDITLSWKNPENNIKGEKLTKIDSVCIYRNNTKITTLKSGLGLGENVSYKDASVPAGECTYKIVVYKGSEAGYPTFVNSFSGRDVPAAVAQFFLTPKGNGGSLTWSAPTTGKFNGYIDLSSLKYSIVRLPDNVEVAKNITTTSYVDNTVTKLGEYAYVITPSTVDGAGVKDTTYPFTLYTNGNIWMGTSDITVCGGKFYDFAGPDKDITFRNTAYALILRPENPENGGKTQVKFSKFDVKDGYLMVFDGEDAYAPQIVGSPFQASALPSQLKNITASAKNTTGALAFYYYPESNRAGGAGWEADISCVTLRETSLEPIALLGELLPKKGAEYEYKVLVVNNGIKAVDKYTVALCEGDNQEVVNSVEITKTLNSGDSAYVSFKYTPQAIGSKTLYGRVSAAASLETVYSTALNLSVQPEETYYLTLGESDEIGIETMYGPVVMFFKGSVTETVHYPSELGISMGKINALRYYNDFSTEMLDQPIKIHISEISEDNLAKGFVEEKDMTLVFNGKVSFPVGENEVLIPLTTPYEYNGKNLVIRVERPYAATNTRGSLSETFKIYYGGENSGFRQIAHLSNEQGFDPTNTEALRDFNWAARTSFVIDCQAAGHLEGVVKNSAGEPLDSVKVSIAKYGFVTYTNVKGEYRFPALKAGSEKVSFEKFDYISSTADVAIVLTQTVTKNITLADIPKVKVSGKIIDNEGAAVSGAKVLLSGYSETMASTGADGTYVLNGVHSEKTYVMTVSKDMFHDYVGGFICGVNDTTVKDIKIEQWAVPALGVSATAIGDESKAEVKWNRSDEMSFNRYVLDDGSSETGFSVANGKEAWFGTFFSTQDSGYICSLDIYGSSNTYIEGNRSERPVSVDIYDRNHRLMYSSDEFYLPENNWITIDFPYSKYNHAFYAMVHFTTEEGYTHHIGCDETGEFAGAETNYYFDGGTWSVVQTNTVGITPFCFMIRANVLEPEGMVKSVLPSSAKLSFERYAPQPKSGKINYDLSEVYVQESSNAVTAKLNNNKFSELKAYQPKYMVYRFLRENKDDVSKYTKLTASAISAGNYVDDAFGSLVAGVYGYAVKAVYGANLESEFRTSNTVSKNMLSDVKLTFVNNTPNLDLEGIKVEIHCISDLEEHDYVGSTNENGTVAFSKIWKGKYKITATKSKYSALDTVLDFSKEDSYAISGLTIKEHLKAAYNLEINKNDKNAYVFDWNKSVDIVDGFEGHPDFTTQSPGKYGWQYKNLSPVYAYTIKDVKFPNFDSIYSYIVFNPYKTTPPMNDPAIAPKEGKKFLACFASPLAPNDKWFISPRLYYTNPFTFSFYTKTFDVASGLERFQVGYSTTGTNVEDFKWIQSGPYSSAGMKWGQDSYTIPGEANYVAIRSISRDQYLLMLDEVFIGNEEKSEIENIVGYKVYLDGKLVTETKDKTYSFANVEDLSKHKAGVVVKYSSGESKMEEITFGGLPNQEPEGLSKVNIYPNPASEVLYLENTDQVSKVEILSLSGAVLGSYSIQSSRFSIQVEDYPSGIYVIRLTNADGSAMKKFIKK